MTRLFVIVLLVGLNARAGDCRDEVDGRISCTAAGFKTLTDALVDCETAQKKDALRLSACKARIAALEGALTVPPPPQPAPKSIKPMVAVVIAVMGTAALTSALLANDLTPGTRVGLGVTGAAAVTSAFIIAF